MSVVLERPAPGRLELPRRQLSPAVPEAVFHLSRLSGELKVARGPDQALMAPHVRSGVVLCAYEPVVPAGAMLHLAVAPAGLARELTPALAEHLASATLQALEAVGAIVNRVRGAVLTATRERGPALDRGCCGPERIGQAIAEALRRLGLRSPETAAAGGCDCLVLTLAEGALLRFGRRGIEVVTCLQEAGLTWRLR